MEYDPVKFRLAALLGGSVILRRCFHLALDWLFLRAWYVRRELKRLKFTEDFHPRRILDAGMGFGQFTDRMMRLFPETRITGLEIDRNYFYGGEGYFQFVHPSVEFLIGDVQALPVGDGKVDLIISVDVMEHVQDDCAAFGEYYRALAPGGYFVMHTPRVQDDAEMHEGERFDPSACQVGEHVRDGYRTREARERLEQAGFSVVRTVRGYGAMGMVAWRLLQGVPMKMLDWSKLLTPIVGLYFLAAFPVAIIAMMVDIAQGDHPHGGSLLVVAQKCEGDLSENGLFPISPSLRGTK